MDPIRSMFISQWLLLSITKTLISRQWIRLVASQLVRHSAHWISLIRPFTISGIQQFRDQIPSLSLISSIQWHQHQLQELPSLRSLTQWLEWIGMWLVLETSFVTPPLSQLAMYPFDNLVPNTHQRERAPMVRLVLAILLLAILPVLR